jgi:hypothetical protein
MTLGSGRAKENRGISAFISGRYISTAPLSWVLPECVPYKCYEVDRS